MDGTLNPPSEAVTALNSAPVSLFLILTSAPGMTPPELSTTVPDRDVKKLPCAWAIAVATVVMSSAASTLRTHGNLIESPSNDLQGLTNDAPKLPGVDANVNRKPHLFGAIPGDLQNRGRGKADD